MASNEPPKIKSTFDESSLECHELVGHGASGYVYRATWKSEKYGNIEVAAKKMPILPSDDIGEKFGCEINYLQTLEHENIITYYGHAVTKENLVIITEYARNGSLHDHLKRIRRLTPALKVKWAIQIAKGIKYLQDKKILHRDVKSGNILITGQNNLKICDFGVAKDLSNTTTTSNAKGTYKWLAPEVYTDEKLSPSADIFAFGVVLWELETCETPYKDLKRPERVIWEVGSKGLRPEIPKTCPRVLKKLMKRCWDKDRRKRPDANEIIQILESFRSSLHTGLQWHHKNTIHADVSACHWISNQQLAVCMWGRVEVHEVTTESSHLAYTLTNQDWEGAGVRVAVSESLPDKILVICADQPYVYQYPRHEAKEMVKKYKIQGDRVDPQLIVANANTAVVKLHDVMTSTLRGTLVICSIPRTLRGTLVICSLPDFSSQSHVQINFDLYDLSISPDYLLVMGEHEMVVKAIDNASQDLCRIKKPDDVTTFRCVSFKNHDKEIYAVCSQDGGRCRVYKYIWGGEGNPDYTNVGCVIDGLRGVEYRSLSVTSDNNGLLAVGEWLNNVKVYSLE
ncbi:uncharacterized protein [Amphiura filiformis]|uniref:uncharacterized protein n=1 Tax=Amphiura filiformis TaxID=82378 RepID=UPI003B226A07